MKKLLIAAALFFTTTSIFAQAQPKEETKEKAPKMKLVKKEEAKVVTMEQPATAPADGRPTKKDGTADMRYKANQKAAKPAGPTKKDGTADMRYKTNQHAAKKKKG